MQSTINANFLNVTSFGNSGHGIYFQGAGNSTMQNIRLQNNSLSGLYVQNAGTSLQITESALYQNIGFDLYNNSSTNINATNNYWFFTNPAIIAERIYDYYDNPAKGIVEFDPYLLEEPLFQFLPADFNQDGIVNGFDLAIFAVSFGSNPDSQNWNQLCDLNNSGQVDGFDLAIFASYFGQQSFKNNITHPFFALAGLKSGQAAPALLYFDADIEKIKSHKEFSIYVKANNIAEAIGLAFKINYDQQLFELIEIIDYFDIGPSGSTAFMKHFDDQEGFALVGVANLDNSINGLNGSGILCELKFRAKQINKPTSFTFSNAGLIAMDGSTELELKTQSLDLEFLQEGPFSFLLDQNFPNPFAHTTTIGFSISEEKPQMVRLEVYNMHGAKVFTLFEGLLDAGFYSFDFNRSDVNGIKLPGGVYFYTLHCGDMVLSRKMVIQQE